MLNGAQVERLARAVTVILTMLRVLFCDANRAVLVIVLELGTVVFFELQHCFLHGFWLEVWYPVHIFEDVLKFPVGFIFAARKPEYIFPVLRTFGADPLFRI